MEIILRTDIEHLGNLGEIINVKPGYARNYLIPKKLAMEATEANKRVFEQQRKKLQEKLERIKSQSKELAERLEETSLEIPVRVGENDKLYGSVTATHIADALAEKGFEISKKKIELDQPIRALGEYNVSIRVYPEVKPEVKVRVVRHGEQNSISQQD